MVFPRDVCVTESPVSNRSAERLWTLYTLLAPLFRPVGQYVIKNCVDR
jgi:hypothetical protein